MAHATPSTAKSKPGFLSVQIAGTSKNGPAPEGAGPQTFVVASV